MAAVLSFSRSVCRPTSCGQEGRALGGCGEGQGAGVEGVEQGAGRGRHAAALGAAAGASKHRGPCAWRAAHLQLGLGRHAGLRRRLLLLLLCLCLSPGSRSSSRGLALALPLLLLPAGPALVAPGLCGLLLPAPPLLQGGGGGGTGWRQSEAALEGWAELGARGRGGRDPACPPSCTTHLGFLRRPVGGGPGHLDCLLPLPRRRPLLGARQAAARGRRRAGADG